LRLFLFFFQAEDGIRDRNVTGVQTCALPIFPVVRDRRVLEPSGLAEGEPLVIGKGVVPVHVRRELVLVLEVHAQSHAVPEHVGRSEERRVGKGGGSRVEGGWSRTERDYGDSV